MQVFDNTMNRDAVIEEVISKIKRGEYPTGDVVSGWTKDKPLLDHQKGAILWLYLTPRALLADVTGSGKSATGLGLLQKLKDDGKLSPENRAIIIVPAISVYGSWEEDGFKKFDLKLNYAIGRGTKKQRLSIYSDPTWEVLLTNYETVRSDYALLEELNFKYSILDEADVIRNHSAAMTKAVKRITIPCTRSVAMTATPIQNSLLDLHSILEAIGLNNVFGSKTSFDRRYQDYNVVRIPTRKRTIFKKELKGFRNTIELKNKLEPYYLRRTYKDLNLTVPELSSQTKWVELTKEQKKLYEQAKNGFLSLTPQSPPHMLKAAAIKLRQICTSTYTAGHTDDHSAKSDWLINVLKNDWNENKVVIFSTWKASIEALTKRLDDNHIKYVVMTGDENQKEREKRRQLFWNDPSIKVLIGTTAIERSLNIQCANIQVNLDMLYNPARHEQLAGRVQRIGSDHSEAMVFSVLAKDTIEEAMMTLLKKKQAISDHVLNNESEVFEKLSKKELLQLIRS